MPAPDSLNGRFGRETLRLRGVVGRNAWAMQRSNLSAHYTTRLEDILVARTLADHVS